MGSNAQSRIEWIRQRAAELWDACGRDARQEQQCWDKAVEEYEAGTAEDDRGPVHPDPAVASGSEPVRKP